MQKLQSESRNGVQDVEPTNGVIYEDGTVRDDASTRAIRERDSLSPGPVVPSIKISSESDRSDEQETPNEVLPDESPDTSTLVTSEMEASSSVERPPQAASEEKEHEAQTKPAAPQTDFSFHNKRLCERWLDNLFMVLYEVCPSHPKPHNSETKPKTHDRISGCGLYIVPRSLTSNPNTSYIGRLGLSGRYLVTLGRVYIIRKRQRRRISGVSTPNSPAKLGPSSWRCTSRKVI